MADPQIEKLLVVQQRDQALAAIERDLARLPVERKSLEAKIAEVEEGIEAARSEIKDLEVRRKELDVEVKSREGQAQRYRTQQLEVKKNEEYRALTVEIERTETEISELEEEEIGIMLQLDEARKAFEARQASFEEIIAEHRRRIAALGQRGKDLEGSIKAARAAVEEAREGVEPDFLKAYDHVKNQTKRAPYVVPIEDHKCGGCHLRVSNEVSRGARDAGEPHFCDQCGRIVYV